MKKILISIFSAMLLGGISLFAQSTPDKDYLCFTATGASSVTLNKVSNPTEITFETSKDGTSWSDYTIGTAIDLADGEKVYFRNKSETPATSFSTEASSKGSHYKFAMTGSIAASGNVMSLIDQDCSITDISATSYQNCFYELFMECTSLTAAPKLPATKLAQNCYGSMFDGCTGLRTAPELPAMTLAPSCYTNMFSGCTELETAPELPATTLAANCYNKMFYGCKKLNYVKVGFTAYFSDVSGNSMWLQDAGKDVTGDKVFVCPADLNIGARNTNHVPSDWSVAYVITANQDPDNKENYYATFSCKTDAYKLPNNVSAYYGKIKDGKLNLFKIEGDIIPADVGVILKASTNEITLIKTDESGTTPDENALKGTDNGSYDIFPISSAPVGTKVLSLGESGVGFYLWDGKSIRIHKAYIPAAAQQ